jgi:hypothetical protein
MITASESVSGAFQLELVKHISMAGVVTQVARVRGISVLGNDNGGEHCFTGTIDDEFCFDSICTVRSNRVSL